MKTYCQLLRKLEEKIFWQKMGKDTPATYDNILSIIEKIGRKKYLSKIGKIKLKQNMKTYCQLLAKLEEKIFCQKIAKENSCNIWQHAANYWQNCQVLTNLDVLIGHTN